MVNSINWTVQNLASALWNKQGKPTPTEKSVETKYSIDGRNVNKKDYFRVLRRGKSGRMENLYLVDGKLVSRGKYCRAVWGLRGRGYPVKIPWECRRKKKRKSKVKGPDQKILELREKIRKRGVPDAPQPKSSGYVSKKHKKWHEKASDFISDNLWAGLVWAAAAGLWTFVWWLRRKDRGGDSDDSIKGAALKDLPPYAVFQRSVARDLNYDVVDQGGIRLSTATSNILIHLKSGAGLINREHNIEFTSGVSKLSDTIPLLYYWMQENIMRRSAVGIKETSAMFFRVADAYGESSSVSYPSFTNTEMADLIHLTSHQIKYGHELFTMEAMIAHLGSYWLLKRASEGKESQWNAARSEDMQRALRAISVGDEKGLLKNLEQATDACLKKKLHHQDQLGMVAALHSLNLSELYYRFAACEENSARRRKYLAKAERRVECAVTTMKNHWVPRLGGLYDLGSIIVYADRLSSEIQYAARWRGPLVPVGVYIPGYGPTAASVIEMGPKSGRPTIIPLTPLVKTI